MIETYKQWLKRPKPCDCGNPGTISIKGGKVWVCERCHRIEQANARTEIMRAKRASAPSVLMPYRLLCDCAAVMLLLLATGCHTNWMPTTNNYIAAPTNAPVDDLPPLPPGAMSLPQSIMVPKLPPSVILNADESVVKQ